MTQKERNVQGAGRELGFVDDFSGSHDFTEPVVHANGTDISWPRGWTSEDAMRWRAEHKLLAVSG